MQIQAEFQPLNKGTGSRVPIRLCSADDARVTAADGQRWWPAISRRPALNMQLFDGDFTGQVATGAGQMNLTAYGVKRADANAPAYAWNAAPVKLWTIDPASGTRALVFEGLVERLTNTGEQISVQLRVDVEPFVQNALTLTYAGTGGIEGPTDLANKIKPLLFGRCFNVEPVLINATDNVYQVSAYGPIHAVTALYERGAAFGSSFGNYADYAALLAADIPNGGWATCLAQGLIRLRAPAYGVITADVDGDKPGGSWLRRTGEIISRLCSIVSVPSGNIDSASLAALDSATAGWPNAGRIGLYLTDQVQLLDLVQQLVRPLNAQAGVSWLGKLFVCRTAIGSAAVVLDAQARRRPAVVAIAEQSVSPPYWRIEMQGARSWRVHGDADIAQGFIPGDEVANAIAPNAANLVPFDRMQGGRGWAVNANAAGLAVDLRPLDADGLRFPIADVTFTAAGQTVVIGGNIPFPVNGAQRLSMAAGIDAFALSGPEPASWRLYADFIDEDGVPTQETIVSGTGASSTFTRRESFETSPAGTRRCVLQLQVTSAGAGVMRIGVREATVAAAALGQTAHPAYTPGPNALDGADVTADQPVVSRLDTATGLAADNFRAAGTGSPFAQLVASGAARDGDVVSFPATLPAPPKIFFLPGGNAPTAGQNVRIKAEGLSASGFTMVAKSQVVTVGSTITDLPSSAGGSGEPARVIDRSNSGAPFDGTFSFRVGVTVGEVAPGEPGSITLAFFVRRSGAWQEAARESFSVTGNYDALVSPGTVDFGTGAEFGVTAVAVEGTGTALSDFVHVRYTLGTVTEVSLTPSGASAIPWQAFL